MWKIQPPLKSAFLSKEDPVPDPQEHRISIRKKDTRMKQNFRVFMDLVLGEIALNWFKQYDK
jgi:hypothetical protein